jgi:DNA gyrase subunit A
MLFFTEKGKCCWLKVFEIPEGSRSTKGRALQNLIQIDRDDRVMTFMKVQNLDDQQFLAAHSVLMSTTQGQIKKTSLQEFSRPRTNGINAINVGENDSLLAAALTDENSEIMLASSSGNAIRFQASEIRNMGRNAGGVRAIKLENNERAIGMVVVNRPNAQLLTISDKGYGKRTELEAYPVQGRGGRGVKTMNLTQKTGHLIGIQEVNESEDIMILTRNGLAIRMGVGTIPTTGRSTQGVRLIRLKEEDQIASVIKLPEKDEDENGQGEEEGPADPATTATEADEANGES